MFSGRTKPRFYSYGRLACAFAFAGKIRERMFAFADIVTLSDRNIQKVLREISTEDISVALKAASGQALEKIFRNMSKRAAAMLEEDMEAIRSSMKEVEEAQERIASLARRLEDKEEIFISLGDDDG